MNNLNRIVCFAGLAALVVAAGCDRRDVADGLARLPANMLESACLSADNCTVYCKDGSIKSDNYPHRCQRD